MKHVRPHPDWPRGTEDDVNAFLALSTTPDPFERVSSGEL
jgi:hypothetical protein